MLCEQLVVAIGVPPEHRLVVRRADVAERDEGVPPQPARILPRDVQPVELRDERRPVLLEPRDEVDVRVVRRLACSALLDAAVPRANVLADVTPVDLRLERPAVPARAR